MNHLLKILIAAFAYIPFVDLHAATVVEIEYFIGPDPGQGNGVTVPVEIAEDASATFDLSVETLNTLPEGFHTIACRAKDDGDWSASERTFFLIYSLPDNTGTDQLVEAEYFIDTDPGQGNGVSFTLSGDPEIAVAVDVSPATIEALENGFHLLGVRARNAKGNWSAVERSMFYQYTLEDRGGLALVSRIDYQWFKAGSAITTPVSLVPENLSQVVTFERFLPLDGFVEAGDYQLVFTPYDELGVRGAAEATAVAIVPVANDADGDGLPDYYEMEQTNPPSATALEPDSDPDGNGRSAFLDFALATDGDSQQSTGNARVVQGEGGEFFVFTYLRNRRALDHVTFQPFSRTDFDPETARRNEGSQSVSIVEGETERVTVTSGSPIADDDKRFFQVEIAPK